MARMTEFFRGYQEAMRDLADKLVTGDVDDMLDWCVNNTADEDVRRIFAKAQTEREAR